MVHQISGWFFAPLYSFDTSSTGNGIDPQSPVVIGPDGSLYGTTDICGFDGQGCETYGCGVVYNLRLPVKGVGFSPRAMDGNGNVLRFPHRSPLNLRSAVGSPSVGSTFPVIFLRLLGRFGPFGID